MKHKEILWTAWGPFLDWEEFAKYLLDELAKRGTTFKISRTKLARYASEHVLAQLSRGLSRNLAFESMVDFMCDRQKF